MMFITSVAASDSFLDQHYGKHRSLKYKNIVPGFIVMAKYFFLLLFEHFLRNKQKLCERENYDQ